MKPISIRPTISFRKTVSLQAAPKFSRNQFNQNKFQTSFNAAIPRLTVSKRFFADTWNDREQGIENYSVRKHDEELLKKLRDAEEARAKAEARAQAAEEKAGVAPGKEATDFVTMHEFLEFRKELVERIRDLEDEIHKLQVSKYEKKKFF